MPLIFQYGSNCLSARLNGPQRLGGAAAVIGRAQTALEFDIAFDVYSQTSGCAACDLVDATDTGCHAWGVLYDIPIDRIYGKKHPDGKTTLEEIEGPRYEPRPIRVRIESGEEVDATTFQVKEHERRTGLWTSGAYVSWIVYGLREQRVPEEYITHVQNVAKQANAQSSAAAVEQSRIMSSL